MSIIALRAWYVEDYEPIPEIEKRPPDIRISKKSLLKSGLRADFLEDSQEVKQSTWFRRYIEGENIEFYIEGSGGYCVANIDLISHEIYFSKQSLLSQLEPTIFFASQTEYPPASEALRSGLKKSLEILNERSARSAAAKLSRQSLTLVESHRSSECPVRLNKVTMRKIRKSMLFIADTTPITSLGVEGKKTPQLISSPNVCVELGCAMYSKRTEQILLIQMQPQDLELEGQVPFDLPSTQILQFQDGAELDKMLPQVIEVQLGRFKLFS
ncbi:MAG: hypothetical protein VKL59_15950 [Nostocaceae cyanobacterium]|nr:hypothetical protein [Nostocaceae cyanobacterium]